VVIHGHQVSIEEHALLQIMGALLKRHVRRKESHSL